MTPDQLREELAVDAESSITTLSHLRALRAAIVDREPSIHETVAGGAYVRDIYQGIENVLVRLLKYHGHPQPTTPDWHAALLRLFSDPPAAGLPLLIPTELHERVRKFRGFRHVFQKRYAVDLRWSELRPLIEDIEPT